MRQRTASERSRVTPHTERALSFWQVLFSVAAAFFGVQSSQRRQRDFRAGNPFVFMLVGLGLTVFVGATFMLAVRLVMTHYGAA